MDEVKDFHIKQHRKNIEMYEAGIKTGIRFTLDKLFANFPNVDVDALVEETYKEYSGI
jgi:hypothetical protein